MKGNVWRRRIKNVKLVSVNTVKPEKNVNFFKYFMKYFMKYFTKYFKAKNFMKF